MLGLWYLIENLVYYLNPRNYPRNRLSPKIVKWLKEEKGYSDFFIKNCYLKDDVMASILRDKAREEYKKANS